jgi:hypothetical protein
MRQRWDEFDSFRGRVNAPVAICSNVSAMSLTVNRPADNATVYTHLW